MSAKILVVDDEPDLEALIVQKFRKHLEPVVMVEHGFFGRLLRLLFRALSVALRCLVPGVAQIRKSRQRERGKKRCKKKGQGFHGTAIVSHPVEKMPSFISWTARPP